MNHNLSEEKKEADQFTEKAYASEQKNDPKQKMETNSAVGRD